MSAIRLSDRSGDPSRALAGNQAERRLGEVGVDQPQQVVGPRTTADKASHSEALLAEATLLPYRIAAGRVEESLGAVGDRTVELELAHTLLAEEHDVEKGRNSQARIHLIEPDLDRV